MDTQALNKERSRVPAEWRALEDHRFILAVITIDPVATVGFLDDLIATKEASRLRSRLYLVALNPCNVWTSRALHFASPGFYLVGRSPPPYVPSQNSGMFISLSNIVHHGNIIIMI